MEQTLINPLIAVRDIHFGSTVIVAGIVFFDVIIASPTLRAVGSRLETTAVAFRIRTALALWTSMAL
jgi:putative copper resistance protein D